MARLVIVSNRIAAPRDRSARAGGLAVALREALQRRGGVWFGWSGEISDIPSEAAKVQDVGNVRYATIDLLPEDHETYYNQFANGTLWPLCHYRLGLFEFRRVGFEGYLRVNRLFAERLVPLLRPDDVIWVHDYHFLNLGAELRDLGVRNPIGFFLHIPFPAPEVLTVLPRHRRLLAGLCAYDLIGLQTDLDVLAFRHMLEREAGGAVDPDGRFVAFGQNGTVAAFPVGIDTDGFARLAEAGVGGLDATRMRDSLGGRKLVIGVDRLDYSKGLPQRLDAVEIMLEKRPGHRRAVTYMQIAPISRGEVEQYRTLRRDLEGRVGHINGRFAEFDWAPVRYLNKAFPRQTLAGFYRAAAVGLVTPLRDGMNLVAKEYIAAQNGDDPGVLVLSRFAGAARALSQALIVNPFDVEELADAIDQALTMPLDERKMRWSEMMVTLREGTSRRWCDDFLGRLAAVSETRAAA